MFWELIKVSLIILLYILHTLLVCASLNVIWALFSYFFYFSIN